MSTETEMITVPRAEFELYRETHNRVNGIVPIPAHLDEADVKRRQASGLTLVQAIEAADAQYIENHRASAK